MDIKRYITREDFLNITSRVGFLNQDGGTLLGGRRYAMFSDGRLSAENQLAKLGELDKTGEGVVDRVFFFEVFKHPLGDEVIYTVVSAEIVERYKYVSDQECQKELALIAAKIKRHNEGKENERI